MNKLLLLLLFFIPAFCANGQTLKGTVIDGESRQPLSTVTVVNLNTQQSAYTDASGNFMISAKKGDPIAFSLIGYKTEQKTTPTGLGTAEMRIDLFRLSYQLEEFVLRPKYTPYQMDSIERHGTYVRALSRERSGSIMSPVTFVAERLSKRSKQLYRFQKSFNYWEDQKYIESRYSKELVQQLTGLKGDTLAYFMNAYPMPYDYARVASELELKMWIREQYKAWVKHPVFPALQAADTVRSSR